MSVDDLDQTPTAVLVQRTLAFALLGLDSNQQPSG